jgi:hypothetical protein
MSAILISHSSRDHLEAARIGKWLRTRGHTSIFLDFDPADGIPPGRNWEVPLFPVRLDDGALPELVAGVQVIDLAPDRSTALERLWRGMLKAGLDPAEIFTWDRGARHERGPYPGLGAFEHTDAAVYFGREGAIREVRAELERQSRQGAGRAVLILGASGAGKSSLMRAGALPRLDREKDRWLALEPFEPQGVLGPLARLAQVLTAADPGGLRQLVARLEEAACRTDPQPLNAEAEMLRLGQARRDATVVLALD